MRKHQKPQCLQTFSLLKKAHVEILSDIEKRRTEEARNLLSKCQQGAIAIGAKIEEAKGEGTGAAGWKSTVRRRIGGMRNGSWREASGRNWIFPILFICAEHGGPLSESISGIPLRKADDVFL